MYIFENIFRRTLFTSIKNREYYIHSLRDTRAFEIDGEKKRKIRKANRIYHIMWAVFISTGSGLMNFFYRDQSVIRSALYFALYFFTIMWILEIFYSKYIYQNLDINRQYKGKTDIQKVFLEKRPGLSSFILLGTVIMISVMLTNSITLIVKWQSVVQWIFFVYSMNLVFFYISSRLLDFINYIAGKNTRVRSK